MEKALMCPQCNAPLTTSRFARSVICSYCGATVQLDETSVSAEMFHKAYLAWNSPAAILLSSWISLGDSHWAIDRSLGQGEFSDVYFARRARRPTELAVLKLLRQPANIGLFDNEWDSVQFLRASNTPGAENFITLLPQPILHGDITGGAYTGQRASLFRWTSGFRHTFEEVRQAYPQGIPPRASIWVWRRILEVLSFIHASGMVHGAVLPSHLLIQENDHGVKLIGYGAAGSIGEPLKHISPSYQSFYPPQIKSLKSLVPQLDLIMSGRCVAAILGGDPETAELPSQVPGLLAQVIQRISRLDPVHRTSEGAWALRDELGELVGKVFGEPKFIPIEMPN